MVGLVSTLALTNTTRANIIDIQREITEASQELATGFAFDVPAELGARTGLTIELRNEFDRLGRYETNIDLFEQQSNITQSSLDNARSVLEELIGNLATVADETSAFTPVIATQGATALEQVVATLNTSFGGQTLFGGVDTATLPFQPPSVQNGAFAPNEVVSEIINSVQGALGVNSFTSAFEVDQFIEGDAFFTAAGGFQGLNSVFDDTNQTPGLRYLETFYNGAVSEAASTTLNDLDINGTVPVNTFDTNADGVVDATDGAGGATILDGTAPNVNIRNFDLTALTPAQVAALTQELTDRGLVENVNFALNAAGDAIDVDLNAEGRRTETRVDDQTILETGIQGDQQPFRDILQGLALVAAFDVSLFEDANGEVSTTALQRYLLGEPDTPTGIGSALQSITASNPAVAFNFDGDGDGRITNAETLTGAANFAPAAGGANRLDFQVGDAAQVAAIRQDLLDAGFVEGAASGQGDFFMSPGDNIEIDLTAEADLPSSFLTFSGSIVSPREGALGFLERGLRGLLELQAELGSEQNTATATRLSIETRRELLNVSILDLESVDPEESATRLNLLDTQLRASFSVTARIQQLTLASFI